ncbi:probable insulin-like peptide 5 [Centruroides vittatus]|uniref:probable insulin-like peptide 5 n=1 Tax=Centruroides vittatus TaxID=120091 RepID=UPI003510D13B
MSAARTSRSTLLLLCVILVTRLHSPHAYKFCGRALADILSLICQNRGGLYSPDSDAEMKKNEIFYELGYYKSKRRGIVDECCKKSCTFETLASYCALPFQVEPSEPLYNGLVREALLQLRRNRKLLETFKTVPRTFKKTFQPTEKPEVRRKNLGFFTRNKPFIYVPRK